MENQDTKAEMSDLEYFRNKRDKLMCDLIIVNKQLDLLCEAAVVYQLSRERTRANVHTQKD